MFSKGKGKNKNSNNKNSEKEKASNNNNNNKSENSNKQNNKSSKNDSKTPFSCSYCGKNWHTASKCFKKKKDEQMSSENKQGGFTNVCVDGKTYNNELLVISDKLGNNEWILDSGCTMHATPNKNLFSLLSFQNEGEVILGDHTSLKIRGVGTVSLIMHNGSELLLHNVSWVPTLRRNLISESLFDDLGCSINTFNGIREVIKDDEVILRSEKRGVYIMLF